MKIKNILFTIYFYLVFMALLIGYYLYGVVAGRKSAIEWREMSLKVIDSLFKYCRIKVKVTGLENIPDGPAIFCANHQSYLDGLIISHLVRRPFIAVTAPFKVFPFPIAPWFKKMQYFEVARDIFEELKFQSALHHDEVVKKSVKTLVDGQSILIYPKGTREYKHTLLPFHAGVAKIALQARCPVVPIVLKGADRLFPPGKFLLSPTTLEVTVENPVRFHELQTDEVQDMVMIENIIINHLPKRYTTEKSIPHYPEGNRAAFFDLDGTLTRKNIYEAMVKKYIWKKRSTRLFLHLLRLVLVRLLKKHGYFYLQAIKSLKGVETEELIGHFREELDKRSKNIFFPKMLEVLDLHRSENNLLFIVSEEPEEILKPFIHWLNIPAYGTQAEVQEGKFTGRVIGHIMKDDFKKDKLIELAHEHNIDLSKSFAYGNSWHDYEMLRIVKHATLVRPTKKLAKRGSELGFKVLRDA